MIISKNYKSKIFKEFEIFILSEDGKLIPIQNSHLKLSDKDNFELSKPFRTEDEAIQALLYAELQEIGEIIIQPVFRKVKI